LFCFVFSVLQGPPGSRVQAILIYDGARGPRALKEQQQEVMNTYSFATSPRS
jgi:hypothetical protein